MKTKCICKQCGRSYIYNGHNSKDYCDKHRHQLNKFGKFLDSNPRTKYDSNEFRLKDGFVEFDTYKPITEEIISTFKISYEDYKEVSRHKWTTNNTGYAVSRINGKLVLLHRFILKPKKGQQVDHVNLDKTDNRRENLRVCNNGLNQQNRKGYNKYNIRGVEKTRSNKWSAYFRNDNKQYHSQGYESIEEAVFARFILEELFGTAELTQHSQELIDKLTKEQKEYVVDTIKSKFNLI